MLTCLSIALFVLVLAGVIRAVFEPHRPFIRAFDEKTKYAYFAIIFGAFACALFAWAPRHNLRIDAVEVAGMKISLQTLETKVNALTGQVDTLSEQLKAFFKYRTEEDFDSRNWNRVRTVSKLKNHGFVLEVTVKEEPIPGSVEVDEGAIVLTHDPKIDGKKIQFAANSEKPDIGLKITYSYLPPKN